MSTDTEPNKSSIKKIQYMVLYKIKKKFLIILYHRLCYYMLCLGANYSIYYCKKIINLYIKNLISIIYYIYKCQIF